MRTRIVGLLLGFVSLGCGSTASESPPPTSSPPNEDQTQTASTPAPTAEAVAAPTFDVHEWGLVDVPLSGPTEIGAGPGQPADMPMSVRKPVIYVHADPGSGPLSIDVVARFPSGELVEHWPTVSEWQSTTSDVSSIAWHSVEVGSCDVRSAAMRGPITQREARACATVDGYCEVADLPEYVTTDASCLRANGFETSLLFYRGRTSRATLPLSVTASGTDVSISSSTAGGSSVLYVTGGRGVEIPWPSAGASATLPTAFTESFDGPALARVLATQLASAGLTSAEVDAFMRAWAEPLFGTGWPVAEDPGARRDISGRFRRPPAGPAPALIYVMPEASVAQLAELTITPRPRSVRRVMVVRVDLPR